MTDQGAPVHAAIATGEPMTGAPGAPLDLGPIKARWRQTHAPRDDEGESERIIEEDVPDLIAEVESLRADCARLRDALAGQHGLSVEDVRLLAWAVSNCHTLARRSLRKLGRDRQDHDALVVTEQGSWAHVLRICEKAGATSTGVLRASVPTEITDGSGAALPAAPQEPKG